MMTITIGCCIRTAAVLSIAGLLAVVYVATKGAKIGLQMLKGS